MALDHQSYKDLSDQQLKAGYWYVTHREWLRQILIRGLILFNLVFWGWSAYLWIYYYFIDFESHENMMRQYTRTYVNYETYKQKHSPVPLENQGIVFFETSKNRYDIMAKLVNPNSEWMALIRYTYDLGDSELERTVFEDFILPEDHKYLMWLGVESEKKIGRPTLEILSLDWRRVHDYASTEKEYFQIDIVDPVYFPPKEIGFGGELPVSELNFTVVNRSNFNFGEMGYAIVLYAGTKPVGVSYLFTDGLNSFQSEEYKVRWFHRMPSVSRVEVKPDVNILDSTIYREFEGVLESDIRDYSQYKKKK